MQLPGLFVRFFLLVLNRSHALRGNAVFMMTLCVVFRYESPIDRHGNQRFHFRIVPGTGIPHKSGCGGEATPRTGTDFDPSLEPRSEQTTQSVIMKTALLRRAWERF